MANTRRKTVKRCVCHKITFSEILTLAEEKNLNSYTQLLEEKICGMGCGMCHPYLNKMMATGETEFYPGDIYIDSDKAAG